MLCVPPVCPLEPWRLPVRLESLAYMYRTVLRDDATDDLRVMPRPPDTFYLDHLGLVVAVRGALSIFLRGAVGGD